MNFKRIIIFAIFLVLSSGCSKTSSTKSHDHQEKLNKSIQTNQQVWSKKKKTVQNTNSDNLNKYLQIVPPDYDDSTMNYSYLKKHNEYLIAGQLINLKEIKEIPYNTSTIATIHVNDTLNGNKNIKGKTIKVEFPGGFGLAKEKYVSPEGEYVGEQYGINNPDQLIYEEVPTFPMPKIGSELIFGASKYRFDNDTRDNNFKKNGIDLKKFYLLTDYNLYFWTKREKTFLLNNPAFYKENAREQYPNIFKLTSLLNKEYLD